MARDLYTGTLVLAANGNSAVLAPNVQFAVWTDLFAGTDVTSQIVSPDGVSPYAAKTDGSGNLLPFRGPDGFEGDLFADTGLPTMRYLLESPTLKDKLVTAKNTPGGTGAITDHGALSGLGDDDHPQYLTNDRGDARYYTQAQVDAKTTAASTASSASDRDRGNHTGTQAVGTITGLQTLLDAKRDSFDASMVGTLAVANGALRKRLPASCVLDSVTVAVNTPSAGSSIIVDVLRNGVSIYGTAFSRPTVPAGSTGVTTPSTNASVTAYAAGDYLTVNVAQVGSTTPGADLVVSIWLRF